MPVTIQNKSDQRVLLRFNSGETRHLAPGEVVSRVESVEIKGNDRIQSLVERRLIAVEEVEAKRSRAAPAAPPAAGRSAAKASRSRGGGSKGAGAKGAGAGKTSGAKGAGAGKTAGAKSAGAGKTAGAKTPGPSSPAGGGGS